MSPGTNERVRVGERRPPQAGAIVALVHPWVGGAPHHQPENAPGFGDRDERAAEMKRATRGVEFLMSYYSILDRAPKGRDEGDAWQVWIRRHDEYDSQ